MPKKRKNPAAVALGRIGGLNRWKGRARKIKRPKNERNKAAVRLGRLGGLKGGAALAKKLTALERSTNATRAASARWGIDSETI